MSLSHQAIEMEAKDNSSPFESQAPSASEDILSAKELAGMRAKKRATSYGCSTIVKYGAGFGAVGLFLCAGYIGGGLLYFYSNEWECQTFMDYCKNGIVDYGCALAVYPYNDPNFNYFTITKKNCDIGDFVGQCPLEVNAIEVQNNMTKKANNYCDKRKAEECITTVLYSLPVTGAFVLAGGLFGRHRFKQSQKANSELSARLLAESESPEAIAGAQIFSATPSMTGSES